ncbi:ParB/RepB/Spo0J family partition protein [Peptacetobacter sp.]|uniref:ParB/RepB/Spo0J family partition protein n=1 Tax=Peptacetobacter sp. TaxID=2991975 RepID=UPI0026299708|nr:ParB/RepB/Spo0J family partition protein [Peptacetobacter sp.]
MEKIEEIEIYKIYPNENQPRKNFDSEKIDELAKSIEQYGLLQPILVKEDENKEYMIIAGERRFTACKKLKMKKVPVIIKDVTYEEIDKMAIIENLQREDLSPVEESKAYKRLIEKYSLTQKELSETIGKSRPYITNSLRLLNLYKKSLDLLDKGEISSGHGKILLRINDEEEQNRLADKILRDNLSVRDLESIVKNIQKKDTKKRENTVYEKDLFTMEAEDTLRNVLGTKVNIVKGKKNGKIEIEYYSDEDLEMIINMLMGE